MAIELPDIWTTLGIGLALLSLVPGMTSVPSASHIEFKISRFCALAAATLFLVKLALWGSEDLTAARIAIVAVLGGVIAVSAAFALHWINKKEKTTSVVPALNTDLARHEPKARPTLEATNHSIIDATGGQFPSEMPFPFAKADNDSFVNMPGIKVTKNADGIMIVSTEPVNQQFPAPTGEYTKFTKQELQEAIAKASAELRSFDTEQYNAFDALLKKYPRDHASNEHPPGLEKEWKAVSDKYRPTRDRLAKLSQSLASECMARIGSLNSSSLSMAAQSGAGGVLHAKFAGPHPASEAAEFLDELSRRLN